MLIFHAAYINVSRKTSVTAQAGTRRDGRRSSRAAVAGNVHPKDGVGRPYIPTSPLEDVTAVPDIRPPIDR